MPSGREMYLWWSGEAESMFVYYLTGALGIALMACFSLTRSLMRKEPIITEILHEDNDREDLVTYLLKIVTSPLSGQGCPLSAKVFMQLTGERKMSQFFQIRSSIGGKAILQRGSTDIFMFKVPESVGGIKSVQLLVAGLNGRLKWNLEEAQLYSPASRDRINIPVTATVLEVLAINSNKDMLASRRNGNWKKIQLLYHQWFAMYGNTVRLGAFTEIVHVIIVFLSLFSLLVLSQMCYIYLPRGDHTLPTVATPKTPDTEDVEDDSGPFDINFTSLLIGTAFSSGCCSLLTLIVEILIRSVRSSEKSPGKAYYSLHDHCSKEHKGNEEGLDTSEAGQNTFFTCPLFLTFDKVESDVIQDESIGRKGKQSEEVKHTRQVAFYLKQLMLALLTEHRRYKKNLETLKIVKGQESLDKQKYEYKKKDMVSGTAAENEIDISLPNFSQMSLSNYMDKENWRSSHNQDSHSSVSSKSQRPQETYLDILKRKTISRKLEKNTATDKSGQVKQPIRRSKRLSGGNFRIENRNENSMTENCLQFDDRAGPTLETNTQAGVEEYGETAEVLARNVDVTDEESEKANTLLDRNTNAIIKESVVPGGIRSDAKEDLVYLNFSNSAKKMSDDTSNKAPERVPTSKGFVLTWQIDQKAWCRRVIKEVCDVILFTREMLLKDQIKFYQLKEKLLNNSHSVLQLLMMACSVNLTDDQYKILNSAEMLSLLWHMSMEIQVYILKEIASVLQQKDNAVLADLVLQSHSLMVMVRHTVYPIMYMVQHGDEQLYLMRHIPFNTDMECLIVEVLKCSFNLVAKYNQVLWQKLKVLVQLELKDFLENTCFIHLAEFVDGNVKDSSTENIVIKKLCNFVEERSREEAWDEVHNEKKFYTFILVKVQLLNKLKCEIKNITQKKYKFDKANDLLPKEPKSRLQMLVEKRRLVKGSEDSKKAPVKTEDKEILEKHSKELENFAANLSAIYKKLKRLMEKQGLSLTVKASELLAQAVLHPYVSVTLGEMKEPDKYKFDNYLHLKRTEFLLAHLYEVSVTDLVVYLLKTATREYDLISSQQIDSDAVLNEIIIKLDTMSEILSKDVETMMKSCIKMERYVLGRKKKTKFDVMVKPSVNSLLQTPVLKKWSGLDLKTCTPSEVADLGNILGDDDVEMSDILHDYQNNSCPNQNNSNTGVIDVDDIEIELVAKPITMSDIIEDLRPVKGYLDYIKHGETLRNLITQMGYIERATRKREYLKSIQINNIIDSYFMIDEGDDSKTLTKAGLFQLEYNCTGEDRKPLKSWVKTVAFAFMVLLQVFIVVYITLIGGQFSTTELQEWMCYFLLAMAVFAMILEPFRALIVALYVRKLRQKLLPKNRIDEV